MALDAMAMSDWLFFIVHGVHRSLAAGVRMAVIQHAALDGEKSRTERRLRKFEAVTYTADTGSS